MDRKTSLSLSSLAAAVLVLFVSLRRSWRKIGWWFQMCKRIHSSKERNEDVSRLFVQAESRPANHTELFVDQAVYSRNRSFRLPFSSKAGKTAKLIATKRFRCKTLVRSTLASSFPLHTETGEFITEVEKWRLYQTVGNLFIYLSITKAWLFLESISLVKVRWQLVLSGVDIWNNY